jgi:hypothetical protein
MVIATTFCFQNEESKVDGLFLLFPLGALGIHETLRFTSLS